MDDKRSEACGRCSMTSVVSVATGDEGAGDRDPFAGARIEVDEAEMRRVSKHQIWLGRVKRRLDAAATRLTYGR